MASSASGQDEPNRVMWLAPRAGKMEPSCLLGTTRCITQENLPESHIINPLLTKLFGQDVWILASFFFCELMDLYFVSVHKHSKKELGQSAAILTSHLADNPYVMTGHYEICPRLDGSFWVVSKTTCARAKTTQKRSPKYNYIFNNWKNN